MADPVVHEARFGVIATLDASLQSQMTRAAGMEASAVVDGLLDARVSRPASMDAFSTLGGDPAWNDALAWATDPIGVIDYTLGVITDDVPLCTAYEFDTGPDPVPGEGGGSEPDPGDLTLLFDNRLI